MKMERELDKHITTISLSFGTKNKLRKLKGGMSYEKIINQLLNLRNQLIHNPNYSNSKENYIEIQNFTRKKAVYHNKNYSFLFSYNQFNYSPNFVFDTNIECVREKGKIIPFEDYIKKNSEKDKEEKTKYRIYFKLLETAICKEIEPFFKHNGAFEDVFSWKMEFRILGLQKRAFQEDLLDKLDEYDAGVNLYDRNS